MTAPACTTWCSRSSTTRSTKRWPAIATTSTVTIHADGSVTVSDNGRGIPVDIAPGRGALRRRSRHDRAARGRQVRRRTRYKVSGGLHGVGVSVVNALSDTPVADHLSRRQRVPAGIRSRRAAIPAEASRRVQQARHHRALPARARRIFTNMEFHYDILAKRLRELSFLNSGVTIDLNDERDEGKHDRFASTRAASAPSCEHLAQLKTAAAPECDQPQRQQDGITVERRDAVDRLLPGERCSASPTTFRRRTVARISRDSALR